MDTDSRIQSILFNVLKESQPKSMLLIGNTANFYTSEYLRHQPDCATKELPAISAAREIEKNKIYDFALLSNALEYMDKQQAGILIASLRDIHSKKLVIITPIGNSWPGLTSYWEETDLLSYGFILKAQYKINNNPLHVYAYDIANYKSTPDWLNSKHWANPEEWNKHWW